MDSDDCRTNLVLIGKSCFSGEEFLGILYYYKILLINELNEFIQHSLGSTKITIKSLARNTERFALLRETGIL